MDIKSTYKILKLTQKKINSLDKNLTGIAIGANEFEVKDILGRSALKKRINQKSWKGLSDTSLRKFKAHEKKIDQLLAQLFERNQRHSQRNAIIARLKPLIRPTKQIKDWKERKKEIIDLLKKRGVETKLINKYVKSIENFDFKKHLEFEDKVFKRRNEIIDDAFTKLLKGYIFHYHSYVCAHINLNLTGNKKLTSIASSLVSLEKAMSGQISLIKGLTVTDNKKTIKTCKSVEKTIAKNIETKLLSFALALYKTRIRSKKDLDTKVELSLKTGMLIRKSILLRAACKRLQFDYVNRDVSNEFKQWQKGSAIKNVEETSKVKRVKISLLNSSGKSYDKKLISIKGKVKSIKIRHVAKKPISYAFITDGKNTVRATIPHIKVDSGGMSPGTYVEITGKWLEKNKESFNKPSLSIDRVDNKQASKKSWLSWLSLQMNDVYQVTPHSINARLSWKPGKYGAINPIKYSVI